MYRSSRTRSKVPKLVQHNAVALAKSAGHGVPLSKRSRGGQRNVEAPFVPPEDWHESRADGVQGGPRGQGYQIVVQPPGKGFRHILSPAEIRHRLAQLPPAMVEPLEVIQLSRMTRKKQSFPCYGMQWGTSLYLYPLEVGLVEYYGRPPKPAQRNEARMYGGRWMNSSPGVWKLVWTEAAIKDFYLNNILIHELGHLLDDRNSGYADRERFAEWFAIEHGFKHKSRADLAQQATNKVVRRHHLR